MSPKGRTKKAGDMTLENGCVVSAVAVKAREHTIGARGCEEQEAQSVVRSHHLPCPLLGLLRGPKCEEFVLQLSACVPKCVSGLRHSVRHDKQVAAQGRL